MGQPLALASLAAAQLGVPVAAAATGRENLMAPAEPFGTHAQGRSLTIAVTSIASVVASRRASPAEWSRWFSIRHLAEPGKFAAVALGSMAASTY